MKYGLCDGGTILTNQCLVLGLCGNAPLNDAVQTLNHQYNGLVSRLFERLEESGQWLWQHELDNHSLLLVHCGNEAAFNSQSLSKRMAEIANQLQQQKITSATISLPAITDQEADWQLSQMLQQLHSHFYQMTDFKSKKAVPFALEAVNFYIEGANESSLHAANAIAQGTEYARRLGDRPANHCTPSYLAQQASDLAQQCPEITATIIEQEQMRELGMGALLAVAQGSAEAPKLVELHYKGSDNAPVILVGKGITFDSGGLSLKPAEGMVEMKYDMCGAASVLGTLKACALLKLPIHVIGLIACAENLPSSTAVKPGDVVTSMSGQTIEILNTDAEGRLVLADALTYAERYKPQFVIDIATLTGAMVIALGNITTGFMTPDEKLAKRLMQASAASHDKCWRLPLFEEYQEALDSPIADMINASFDRSGGAIKAGCFLARFTRKYRWAHLDIAGTAWVSGKKRQATGRPVSLLMELLRHASAG